MSFSKTNSMESNTQRPRTTRFKTEIDKKAKKIVELVNNNTIFQEPYSLTLETIEKEDGNILVFFNITDNPDLVGNEKAYVIGKYIKQPNGNKKGHCTYASSELGMKTGTFLFNLLLLLNYKLNVEDFTLDNFAEDQERAALGIYKLFEVNKRDKDPLDFKGKSLEKQLSEAMGEMRLRLRSDTKEAIKEEFYKIINTVRPKPDGPWDTEFADGIRKFLSQMSEQAFYAMGVKKTRKTRKSKKSKKVKKTRKSKKTGKSKKNKKSKKVKKQKKMKK